ncbi:MAG: nucleotide exchange factor GrpE [Candidatus Gracilibacteria bacterium]|nr:nucleotide exchange factor GrpE [Candidatus Gracilibacteria bacterium]MDQ7022649.1 nucleotide exchange factor GrpE [Candidatus Gracilibacteria bacterium]
MTKNSNDRKDAIEESEIMEEIQEEIENLKDENGEISEEKVEEAQGDKDPIFNELKEALLKSKADYENFKKRTSRDKDEMVFFIKSKIINPILKRLDDVERIIKNTPDEEKETPIFKAVLSLESGFKKDLSDMGVKSFISLGEEVDPNKHDVMTQIPGKPENIICDEFEKGYELDSKVLRIAKVVVGAGE